MNNIPTIGGARGIFEIFVPGVFLLLNLAAILYLLPFIDQDIKNFIIDDFFNNPILSFFIIVCFGYLFGVILRLFRADKVDRFSAWFNRRFKSAQEDRCIFSWDNVLEEDGKKLLKILKDYVDIDWVEKAKIRKSDDMTISISEGENSAEPRMDKKMKKLTLKISKENFDLCLIPYHPLLYIFGYFFDVFGGFLKSSKRRTYHLKVKKENDELKVYARKYKLWACEKFPYIGRIGEVCKKYLPPDALDFYNKTWADRRRKGRQNRQFFNFCKTIINSVDVRAASEIYAAEALNRYISGIFYSLVIAFCLLFGTVILNIFSKMVPLLLLFISVYLFAIVAILRDFRLIRIKEVEIVFAATFKNRSIFEEAPVTADNTV